MLLDDQHKQVTSDLRSNPELAIPFLWFDNNHSGLHKGKVWFYPPKVGKLTDLVKR